jgi:predicted transcriptional regulator
MPTNDKDLREEMAVRLLGSTSRPRILNLLLGRPQQAFYQREIMYETGLSLQTIQRELENLVRLGILKKRQTKARVYYQVNSTSPWYKPLREICELVGNE